MKSEEEERIEREDSNHSSTSSSSNNISLNPINSSTTTGCPVVSLTSRRKRKGKVTIYKVPFKKEQKLNEDEKEVHEENLKSSLPPSTTTSEADSEEDKPKKEKKVLQKKRKHVSSTSIKLRSSSGSTETPIKDVETKLLTKKRRGKLSSSTNITENNTITNQLSKEQLIIANNVELRLMEIDDLYKVWKLGESLFDEKRWPNLYRTWDCYSVTELFNTDSEFCLVAEDEDDIIGFCMGTTIKKAAWKYGYLEWLGVDTKYQRAGIARRLFDEFFKLVLEDGVRILLVDTQADNIAARRFFEKIGFSNAQPCVYLSKNLYDSKPVEPVIITTPINIIMPESSNDASEDIEKKEIHIPTINPIDHTTKVQDKKKKRKVKKRKTVKIQNIKVREMSLEDVSVVFHLGEQVFTAAKSQSHYRSWDQFTVVDFFNGDPQYSLVAEVDKKVVGFCLGTTIQKSGDMGKYGYVTWLGVKEKLRRRGIGTHLYEDILKRMITANVKILLVDTEEGNTAALNFFAKHGFDAPTKHVYLDLNVKSLAEAQST